MNLKTKEIRLQPANNKRLISLCGPFDDNLKQLEHQLNITINRRDNFFRLIGTSVSVDTATNVLVSLYSDTETKCGMIHDIDPKQVYLTIKQIQVLQTQYKYTKSISNNRIHIATKYGIIKPRTKNQTQYIYNIFNHDITFGIGPAGTGKTYLAIAAAVDLLERKINKHIILTRPAIEAGEKLGFLPGDLNQKSDPYVRPLYDALFNILGHERVEQLIQKNIIEVAPLAYMRGRTLNDSVIILDESQNTTITQMKMFLTRIGFHSTVIITGDITQIDLPPNQSSGLTHAIKVLTMIKDISFNFFTKDDSVRHAIVSRIIDAYEAWDNKKNFEYIST
ncbi:PhoH family protein [Blochmannia endosymbiont of Camponotus sp. C-003]|uniref:PhoH family protein n=1 Tax=unclassified Candidatus Blochmanniella TaxID=711328 RepID=UPI0020249B20|nr:MULTISPECIES: PhoH family protein [unclassified Candidatus Blochmannia]URJ23493.1 PhoH family protein [Blochmannia endosymbiont of Camponotus sp. C-003]URJ28965.1 PhoH family protein [Blochmannia endosymbiont of Camponotus sp. C-046]